MDLKLKFANIQGWMYDYCDNLREVVALSIIYGFSQDEESSFHGSLQYLQQLLLCSKPTVIETLKSLEDKGLIIKTQKVINNVTFNEYKAVLPVVKEFYHPSKNSLPNNNNINNNTPNNPTLFNNKDSVISPSTSKRVKSYSRPTLEEVAAYCEERNNGIDPQYFLDYQNARGWLIGGKTPVKDWKAAIRTWESKNKRDNRPLDVRRDEFYDKVNAFLRTPEYAGEKELLYGFYNYWAQEKDGRMLWEMQPAFDIERRLRIEKTKRKN